MCNLAMAQGAIKQLRGSTDFYITSLGPPRLPVCTVRQDGDRHITGQDEDRHII